MAMMTPAAFAGRFGVPAPDTVRGARLAALQFAVPDTGAVKSALEGAGIEAVTANSSVILGPQAAIGAVLVFATAR